MRTREQMEAGGSPGELLRAVQQRHSRILEEWGLSSKARRYLVERAGSRSIEDQLIGATNIVLGSKTDGLNCLYLGFQRPVNDIAYQTKIVLVGTKNSHSEDYIPNPDSYFNDTDCRVANELLDELTELQQTVIPNYDLQFGIVR